jgi:energy-coupling factor transporter ATP-binding protein EcfA2
MLLFVDEPTSGLSSMDSEKVMNLLKDQAHKGKLVVANIHQPSSEIFKLFDKLWILDKGGYPIYQGNPVDAIVYFKTATSLVNAAESECACCGTITPDQILRIVEEKEINEYGKETQIRKTSPETWYYRYIDNIEKKIEPKHTIDILPDSDFKIPDFVRQFQVFTMRNLLSKLTNKQYLIINLLEAPILAFILGVFTKYITPEGYIFGENMNLPVFLFMAVVVALFLGLTISAEEIIKDRKILEREMFLKLSWFSYINSKIVVLFAISALQTFLYVLIGNAILEIEGMLLPFWLILFSAACMGNLIGLNISSGLDSVIAIYVLIPLILVPQLLLGGAMIDYDDLNKGFTNRTFVPIIGTFMTTRWAYEALTVEQFKKNKFERIFYEDEKIISDANYKTSFLIPQLQIKLGLCMRRKDSGLDSVALVRDLRIIKNELEEIPLGGDFAPYPNASLINYYDFDEDLSDEINEYLGQMEKDFSDRGNKANERKDNKYQMMIAEMGQEAFVNFKQNHYNKKLSDIVLNRNEINKVYQSNSRLIQKKDPIFMNPTSDKGRAHFYAPIKIVNKVQIDTLLFNVLMMWLFLGLTYLMLVFDLLRKLLKYLQSLNFQERFAQKKIIN